MWRLLEEAEAEALSGGISRETAERLCELKGADVMGLAALGGMVKQRFRGNEFDTCALANAKSGRCSEDCVYCAQSAHYNTNARVYPLMKTEEILKRAEEAVNIGAQRFCIVTSGRTLSDAEFSGVIAAFEAVKNSFPQLLLDASIGELNESRARLLKEAGVRRYNHNIETAPSFYEKICTTHSFKDRLRTALLIKDAGLELCCGGIIGLGEDWSQRIEMAFMLKEIKPDCVPINILIPHQGTPVANNYPVPLSDIIKFIALMRLIIPYAVIKIAGGRERNLGDFQGLALLSGANGIIVGGYLTTGGRSAKEDSKMVQQAKEFLADDGSSCRKQ